MSRNPDCTVYVGNLDEKVSERVLYDILIQAGRVVDIYIPRDKETQRIKGFAFAEYESEQIAEYAVKLFSGLVSLHNKLLKFAISGQDKTPQNSGAQMTSNSDSSFRQSQRPHPTSVSYSGGTSSPFSRLSSNGYRADIRNSSFDYSRSIPGSNIDSVRHETYLSRPSYDSRYSIPYPPYY